MNTVPCVQSIMVVDDDADIRSALGICLSSEGYQVTTCFDGQDAIDQLEGGASPHAIILDLMMPRMNGFDVLRALRSKEPWSRIPVVIVSANRGYTAEDLGASSILRKPFELDDLVEALKMLGRRFVAGP
jgi:CheY-like chemotaxis protein